MKLLAALSCVFMLTCCNPRKEAAYVAREESRPEANMTPDPPFPLPEKSIFVAPPPTESHFDSLPVVKKKSKRTPVSVTTVVATEPLDSLEVETDTKDWIVGKVGIVMVAISSPTASVPGLQSSNDVDIGVDVIPVSDYYLVALEPALEGYFDILPTPGQQPKQHRAKQGYAATWRYQVTPIKTGKVDLLFTLKTYQSDRDQAGTNIAMRPWHLDVTSNFGSRVFLANRWVGKNGGWGVIIGLVAASVTTLGYTEWWRRKRGKQARSLKTTHTSGHCS